MKTNYNDEQIFSKEKIMTMINKNSKNESYFLKISNTEVGRTSLKLVTCEKCLLKRQIPNVQMFAIIIIILKKVGKTIKLFEHLLDINFETCCWSLNFDDDYNWKDLKSFLTFSNFKQKQSSRNNFETKFLIFSKKNSLDDYNFQTKNWYFQKMIILIFLWKL